MAGAGAQHPEGHMELSLREYLTGHVLSHGFRVFEDGMNDFVKDEVREHFNRKLKVDVAAEEQRVSDYQTAVAEREALDEAICKADERLKGCADAEGRIKAQEEVGLLRKKRKQLPKLRPPPEPAWVQKCSEYLSTRMKSHAKADGRWDVFILVQIVRALLPTVFFRHVGHDDFHARELLDGILRIVELRNGRAHARAHSEDVTESDVLEALRQMAEVLRMCKCGADAEAKLRDLLSDTAKLLQKARELGAGDGADADVDGPTFNATECNMQLLHGALASWELYIEKTMGLVVETEEGGIKPTGESRLEYDNGSISFGSSLDGQGLVKRLKPHFKPIAVARHYYFHHTGKVDLQVAYKEMKAVADAVAKDANGDGVAPWVPPHVVGPDALTPTTLRLSMPSVRMSVPVARVQGIVGRDDFAKNITAALKPGSRVLIHGSPGVGKDTVMAEVAHQPEVRSVGGLQAWLQASSDAVLRRQLIALFATHRPMVVVAHADDAEGAIKAIKAWLADNHDWILFFEDVSTASTTLWEVLPDCGVGGCALVSSQSPLHDAGVEFERFELPPITTEQSLELLRNMSIFKSKAPTPPDGETEAELEMRCGDAGAAECYIAPLQDESTKQRKARRKIIEVQLLEHNELSRPKLREFLKATLGNLPLSVVLCGHMLRAGRRVANVTDLIELFEGVGTVDPKLIDQDGRNPMRDTHFFGLYKSVKISLERLRKTPKVPREERERALALLAMLSLLSRTRTPTSLLSGHALVDLAGSTTATCYAASCGADGKKCYSAACAARWRHQKRAVSLLTNGAWLEKARQLCVKHGLLQEAADGSSIGVMHQMLQLCLRYELVAASNMGDAVAEPVRAVLRRRFNFDELMAPSKWPALRAYVPCVQAWGEHVFVDGDRRRPPVSSTPEDSDLLTRVGLMLLRAEGDAVAAESVFKRLACHAERALPNDPLVGVAKRNLGRALTALGRHNDALKQHEEALAFRRKVLPESSPDIATSMSDVGASLTALQRPKQAHQTQVDALEIHRRELLDNHPDLAVSMRNLGRTHFALDHKMKARDLFKEVLEIRRRILPEDHPDIAWSVSDLARAHEKLNGYEAALELDSEVLEIRKRVLPADHPDIAKSMSNIATSLAHLATRDKAKIDDVKRAEALKLNREVVEIRQRVLPEGHPDILQAKSNLAMTHARFGEHDAALALHKEVLESRTKSLAENHPLVAVAMGNVAKAQLELGNANIAIETMHAAIGKFKAAKTDGFDPKPSTGRWLDRELKKMLKEQGGGDAASP